MTRKFEVLDGFGVMTNVYDSIDYAANAVGIGLALATDIVAGKISARRQPTTGGRSSALLVARQDVRFS